MNAATARPDPASAAPACPQRGSERVPVADADGVRVALPVAVGTGVAVGLRVAAALGLRDGDGVGLGVREAVAVAVGIGVPEPSVQTCSAATQGPWPGTPPSEPTLSPDFTFSDLEAEAPPSTPPTTTSSPSHTHEEQARQVGQRIPPFFDPDLTRDFRPVYFG